MFEFLTDGVESAKFIKRFVTGGPSPFIRVCTLVVAFAGIIAGIVLHLGNFLIFVIVIVIGVVGVLIGRLVGGRSGSGGYIGDPGAAGQGMPRGGYQAPGSASQAPGSASQAAGFHPFGSGQPSAPVGGQSVAQAGVQPGAQAGGRPAPDWYPDPQNPALVRWWDGQSWTPHVQSRR
ncbi:MAG: DUF2510 domain-containing protein [Nocardiopsaceae bacterium]|nr:DUF2510 domain-containing protein [Nocardiopsaceae bacterium]